MRQSYVILSGRVALKVQSGGRRLLIQTLYAGDELSWSAMLNRARQFQARALEPVELLSFEASQLHEACASNPYFAKAFLEHLLRLSRSDWRAPACNGRPRLPRVERRQLVKRPADIPLGNRP